MFKKVINYTAFYFSCRLFAEVERFQLALAVSESFDRLENKLKKKISIIIKNH